jgi:hypothetical protein
VTLINEEKPWSASKLLNGDPYLFIFFTFLKIKGLRHHVAFKDPIGNLTTKIKRLIITVSYEKYVI